MATPTAAPNGGKDTPIERSLIDRLTGALRGMAAGFSQGYFPPGKPLSPQAPEDTKGRAFDYAYGRNLNYTPRGDASISFDTLRRVSDPAQGGLDLLRLAIETRKDQMVTQKWSIRGRKENDDGGENARMLEQVLRRPDGANAFIQWLRLILEDHFVIDAPTIYIRNQTQGLPLLEVMDGATMNLLVDDRGRTPVPPLAAYQQVLKGTPANDYTTKEIGYFASNPRPNRLYGMSRVEQVVGIVTIALNRQLSVLAYYTQGNIPEMLIGVPDSWNLNQIKEYQTWWDAVLQGNVEARRGARFVPGATKPMEIKTEVLKNDFDEWLARVICYCFSLSPESLVKQTNRATAQTAHAHALEEGLEPTKVWFKSVMDDLLLRVGFVDLEFAWVDEEIQDPLTKSQVISSYTGGRPIMGLDEARKVAGLGAADAKTRAELDPIWKAPVNPLGGGPNGDNGDGTDGGDPTNDSGDDNQNDPAAKRNSGRGSLHLGKRQSLQRSTERAISRVAAAALAEQKAALLAVIAERDKHRELIDDSVTRTVDQLQKVAHSEDDLRELLRSLDQTEWSDSARAELRQLLSELAEANARTAAQQIAGALGPDADVQQMLAQANERAIAWAQTRVENLIVEVSHATRDAVNELSASAIAEGLTNTELAARIGDGFEFSKDRALRIARTETANAEVQGQLATFRESGVVDAKEWSADLHGCEDCLVLDGQQVPLDGQFLWMDTLVDGPPAHPNCRCSILPVVAEGVATKGTIARIHKRIDTLAQELRQPRRVVHVRDAHGYLKESQLVIDPLPPA